MSAVLTFPVTCVECRAQRADANGLLCDYHRRRLIALLRVQVEQNVRESLRPKPGQPCGACGRRPARPDGREVVAATLAEYGLDAAWLSEQEGRLCAALCPPGVTRSLGTLLEHAWGIETRTPSEEHLVRITAFRINRWRLEPRGWRIAVVGPGLRQLGRCAPSGIPLPPGQAPGQARRPVDVCAVARLYAEEGWGIEDVAGRLGVSAATVRQTLADAGVTMRLANRASGVGQAERLRREWAEGGITLSALVQQERLGRRMLARWLGVDAETTP